MIDYNLDFPTPVQMGKASFAKLALEALKEAQYRPDRLRSFVDFDFATDYQAPLDGDDPDGVWVSGQTVSDPIV